MKDRDFKGVWIPKEIWLSTELSTTEKVLLTEISSLDNENHCTASNDYFATFCNCGITTITRAIKHLEELRYIAISDFDGRHRVIKMMRQPNQNDEADSSKRLTNNISNNTSNNISNNKLLDIETKTTTKTKKFDYNTCIEEIKLRYSSNDTLVNKLIEYLNYLLSIHTLSYTKQWITRLDKLDSLQGDKVSIVSQSLTNDWKTFYDVKTNYRSRSNDRPQDGCGIESVKSENLELVDKIY